MKIEFEFCFDSYDVRDGNLKHSALNAVTSYIEDNKKDGNIGEVKFVELADWDQDDGLNCCSIMEGSEEDLRYLVFKNAGMDMGPDGFEDPEECQYLWENCVELL
tara:strand:+ start:167 stop:481 length:315 start_codon:yes stop_codon:yes gene_type:complete